MKNIKYGKAICYSGFRHNQSPLTEVFPSYNEVLEDLEILEKDFDYIRMYSPSEHAEVALKVIKENGLHLKVMLGIDLLGEISNDQCSWGGSYDDETIQKHVRYNDSQLEKLISLANYYEDIIFSVSAGNESVPEWNENLVSVERVLHFVKELKKKTNQLVTYCENFYYWTTILDEVAKEVDFISIHTYPVWTGVNINDANHTSIYEYNLVANKFPHKNVIITEAGWPTHSDDRTIKLPTARIENQEKYVTDMDIWSIENQVLVFFFEAFDEPWKGSLNPNEPEKHWGFYNIGRRLKINTEKV